MCSTSRRTGASLQPARGVQQLRRAHEQGNSEPNRDHSVEDYVEVSDLFWGSVDCLLTLTAARCIGHCISSGMLPGGGEAALHRPCFARESKLEIARAGWAFACAPEDRCSTILVFAHIGSYTRCLEHMWGHSL